MIILAIDPGTSCGFAIGHTGDVITSGVWQLAPARGESPGMRYIKLRSRLNEMRIAFPDLGLVVYEQPQMFLAKYRGGTATEIAYALVGIIQAWCAEVKMEHANVHAATLKKFATGKGNANKDEMRRVGLKRWPNPITLSGDEIDALWILEWARKEFAGGAESLINDSKDGTLPL